MRAFSFYAWNLKHANFLRETRDDCRFSGVEAVFTLEFPMFRALEFVFPPVPAQVSDRKFVHMAPRFRNDHKMQEFSGAVFHVLHGVRRKRPLNSEKSVRRRTFLTAKMLICDIFSLSAEKKLRTCGVLISH